MNEEELPVSNEFVTFVKIELDYEQKKQLARYLNLHYLGDVNCNELDESGFYFPKYPEKETKEFKDAFWRANTTQEFQVKVIYDVNGNCKMELV